MHVMEHSGDKKDEDKIKENAVQQLTRMPAYCPVGSCPDFLFPSNIMMHILHKHSNDKNCTSSEIYEHRPLLLSFNPKGLQYGQNRCVAVLMYGGIKDSPHTQPGLDDMSVPNSGLLNNYQQYCNYLPIMLLVCRSSWFAHMTNKQVEQKLLSDKSDNAGIYVFWLVSPITTRKLYYTLTIFDRQYISSRSAIRVVRNYTDFQDPSDFLPIDENYVLLRDMEVAELMSINRRFVRNLRPVTIPMELIVYQAPLPATPPEDDESISTNDQPVKQPGSKPRLP